MASVTVGGMSEDKLEHAVISAEQREMLGRKWNRAVMFLFPVFLIGGMIFTGISGGGWNEVVDWAFDPGIRVGFWFLLSFHINLGILNLFEKGTAWAFPAKK